MPACCSAWLPPHHGAPPSSAAGRYRRVRRLTRACAPVQRYSCMVAKYKKFGVADAGRPGSPYREHVILDLPATRSMKARHRKRPNKSPHMAGYRNPADGNIETYPGRRVERIAMSIESPGTEPGWHPDAVEVNALV